MPVFKNEDNGTWYVMARYVNWKGERKQKCKRGFATKREAQEWERTFQLQNAADMDMTFEAFTELYEKDTRPRLKENTWLTKEHIIYAYGQEYEDDQFNDVIAAIRNADTVVMGSPLYWHNICGLMRNFLDRCYGPIEQGEFKGKELYFIMQGASPEKWQLEACEFTMSRFAGLYGFSYKGMITNSKDAKKMR